MSDNNIIFKYELYDAWMCPIASVSVSESERLVQFGTHLDEGFNRFEPNRDKIHALKIDELTVHKLKSILKDDRIYAIKPLEAADVMDGYLQYFLFCDGEKSIKLYGDNLDYCKNEPERYPNSIIVIEILESIGELLIPEGVEKQCFMLRTEY